MLSQLLHKSCSIVKIYPIHIPIIYNLSKTTSISGNFTEIYIFGLNFIYQNTTVSFGTINNISISFFNSHTISFIIPSSFTTGIYSIKIQTIQPLTHLATISNELFYTLT